MAPHLRRFDKNEVAKERLRIINYYQKYGEKACKEAFKVDRKTIWVWKKRLKSGNQRLSCLIPRSTRPKQTRTMVVDPQVLDYIKQLRKKHVRLGKSKVKPLLDQYCLKENLPTCSEAKIGRIISKHHLFYQKSGRVYHNPGSNHHNRWKKKRLRVKYAPKPKDLGHIQMDTVLRIEDGLRYYLYSAIDIKGKFALSLAYKRANTKNTLDFFKKLEHIYPGQLLSVQTDNGSEFLGVFREYLARKAIKHYFIYPRCPRINGVVERYQRSLQEEFIDPNVHLIHNQDVFSRQLAEYIIFYNTKRVHQSLDYETPMDYLVMKGGMSKKYRACTSA
jgi:putative transposase